jgi:DNA-binding NarL/FixJ family response regulator
MNDKQIRILIADDDLLMLANISKLLQAHFDVVGTVQDGGALLEAAYRLQPDVIVTDISMPTLSGIAAARKIRDSLPLVKLIFLTMHGAGGYRREALSLAAGYVLKSAALEELAQAVRDACQGAGKT